MDIEKMKAVFEKITERLTKEEIMEMSRAYTDGTILEMILAIFPDITKSFKTLYETNIKAYDSKIQDRGLKGKIKFTLDEIDRVTKNIESEQLREVYSVLNSTLKDFEQQSSDIIKPMADLKAILPEKYKFLGEEDLINLVSTGFTGSEEQINRLPRVFDQIGGVYEPDSFMATTIKSENPILGLLSGIIFIHYEKEFLKYLNAKLIELQTPPIEIMETNEKDGNKEFTTARQVLAIHYIMDQLNVYSNTDKTEIARFIQFLTGKETGVAKIGDTSIYKKLKNPLAKSDKQIESDLIYIRTYFEKLGLKDITAKINKEIGSKA